MTRKEMRSKERKDRKQRAKKRRNVRVIRKGQEYSRHVPAAAAPSGKSRIADGDKLWTAEMEAEATKVQDRVTAVYPDCRSMAESPPDPEWFSVCFYSEAEAMRLYKSAEKVGGVWATPFNTWAVMLHISDGDLSKVLHQSSLQPMEVGLGSVRLMEVVFLPGYRSVIVSQELTALLDTENAGVGQPEVFFIQQHFCQTPEETSSVAMLLDLGDYHEAKRQWRSALADLPHVLRPQDHGEAEIPESDIAFLGNITDAIRSYRSGQESLPRTIAEWAKAAASEYRKNIEAFFGPGVHCWGPRSD